MVRIQSPIRANQLPASAQIQTRKTARANGAAQGGTPPAASANSAWKTIFSRTARLATPPAAGMTPSSASVSTTSTTADAAPALAVSDWRAIFTAPPAPTAAPPPAQCPAPTAESVFGANPWLTQPSGVGPGGIAFGYNPHYFATVQTAAKVAEMVGGTVVESNQFTPNGGCFNQSQPNYMVRLPDGRMINPGLVASFYSHGYPQSYVHQMIADEVRNA